MKIFTYLLFVAAVAFGAYKIGILRPISSGAAASAPAVASAPGAWLTDFAAASALAQKENRPLLLNFTGSDWCPWCIKMDEEVLNTPAFQSYAAGHLVLVTVDFPRNTPLPAATAAQNNDLQQKFGVEGFPTFVVLSSSGSKLAEYQGYQPGGPSAFIAQIKQATGQ
jgi:thioredoxin-related protein